MAKKIVVKVWEQILSAVVIAFLFWLSYMFSKDVSGIKTWIGGVFAVLGFVGLVGVGLRIWRAILSPAKDFVKTIIASVFKTIVSVVALILGFLMLGGVANSVLGVTALIIAIIGLVIWVIDWAE